MKFDYEYYTLKNGLRVFLMPSDTVYSATIAATVKTGSAHETEDLSGITHFVEHVALLSGTRSWPTRDALNEVREVNGAKYNGSTGKESLDYWINIPYNKVDFGIQYIYEILYECTLNPDYINQERDVIIDEISKVEDNPNYQNSKFIIENLNTHNSGYTKEIAGTKETVEKFSIDLIKNQYEKLHSPNKILFSVVGNFDTVAVKKMIERLFEELPLVDQQAKYPIEGIKENIIKTKSSEKTNLIFTSLEFPALGANETTEVEKSYIELIFSILSGPMSSRLVKRLRQKENLLYGIGADQTAMETYGHSSVYYEIPVNNFEKAFKATVEELEELFERGTSEKELAHYREYFSNRYLVNYDNVFSYSKLFRGPLFWDHKPMNLEEIIEVIKETTPKDINKLIPNFINMNKINAFAFGNVSDKTESIMKDILKKYI